MNAKTIITFALCLTALTSACGGAVTETSIPESPAPGSSAEGSAPLIAASEEWELEITGAQWGGDAPMIPVAKGQTQLLVFTNLTYVGAESDVPVPAFGVKDETGSPFVVYASFGYGASVPEGGQNWISSFVTGDPATRHFITGEAFRPLMFTFAGPENAQTFVFFFGGLTLDFTSVVESK